MSIFWALVLTALVFAFVAYPLFRQKARSAAVAGDEKFRELHSKRDTAYSMLKELEFDYQSGILTEEDYRELEARYKKKAISILKDADELEKGNEVEGDIEAQVQRLRRGKNSQSVVDDVEREVLKVRRTQGKFCSQCGTASQENDRFCSKCGAKLK